MSRVQTVWLFTSIDPETDVEGVLAVGSIGTGLFPLVATTEDKREKMREIAKLMGQEHGRAVRMRIAEVVATQEVL